MPQIRRFVHHIKHSGKAAALAILAAALAAAAPAVYVSANQSPVGCTGNRYDVSIIKDKTEVQQGDTLTYTVTASNLNGLPDVACDITAASITVQLPAADGTPTGTIVTLESSRDFPSNTGLTLIGTVPYVVNVNAGVTDIVTEVRSQGILHDAPVDHMALIDKTIGTSVVALPAAVNSGSGGGASASSSAAPASAAPRLPNTGTARRL